MYGAWRIHPRRFLAFPLSLCVLPRASSSPALELRAPYIDAPVVPKLAPPKTYGNVYTNTDEHARARVEEYIHVLPQISLSDLPFFSLSRVLSTSK